MKKITGLVVILVALVLGSYYGMGYLTEQKLKQDLKIFNQSNGGVSVELEKYTRGWFTSEALLDWKLHVPEHGSNLVGQTPPQPSEDYRMKMPITIHHGPIIIADKTVKFGFGYAHTELSLPPNISEQFNKTFTSDSTQPKLELSFFVNYLNNTKINASIPDFKLTSKMNNGGQLEWQGMKSATNVSSDRNKIKGDFTIDGFLFTKDQTKVQLSSITSEYNLHRTLSGIYLGDANMSFPSLVITAKDQKVVELSQFDVHSETNIESDLFSSHFKTSLQKFIIHNKAYGPGVLDVSIRNLDAEALAKINEQANQIQQGTDQQRQQAVFAILPELPKLLSKGPEFEVSEMSIMMPEGKIEGNMLVTIPKSDTSNPFELIQKIQGKGKLKIPVLVAKTLLNKVYYQTLGQLSQQTPQNIQQGIVQQMQQQQTGQTVNAPDSTVQSAQVTAAPAVVNQAEQIQKAADMTDKQLASMLQSGFLKMQDNDYTIELSFSNGQLTINDKPFNPAMLKFQ